MAYYNGKEILFGAKIGGGTPEGAVLYTEQELTDEQKAQARDNIGAVSEKDLEDAFGELSIEGTVKYNESQNLTDEQKELARGNIGASAVVDPYKDYQPDVPESIGVLNAILNVKQLAEIAIKPLVSMPQKAGNWEAGKTKYGLPYSSSRVEEGFVPNFVSLETFMTALKNPNSYLYTVDLGKEYNNQNGTTYYGTVCSTLCAYALNIVPNYTTHQWQDIPGMEYVPWQSVYALKLGDTICHHTSGHVVMVTDITRNKRGKIGKITITEAATVKVKVTEYTPEELAEEYPIEDYAFHRYSKIHEVQHIPSPFVAVEDEDPQAFHYNTAIIPRKGDKANWLKGVPVEIDLLEKSGYTDVEVYKDGVLFQTESIGSGGESSFDRTVYGLGWRLGSAVSSNSTKHIRTDIFPCDDIVANISDGAMLRVHWKTADGTDIRSTDFISGEVVFNNIAPDTAKLCVIDGRYADERDITDVDALAAMLVIKVADDATAVPIATSFGSLSSSTGAPASNNARFRSDFIPIQNLRIDGSENVEYNIYYYDDDKEYLIRRSTDWLSGSNYVMDGKPDNAVYFRLVGKNKSGTIVSTNYFAYSLDLPATIIGGVSEGGLDVLALNDLEYGSYKARLTNGTNHSDWCYWIVVDAVSNAVATDNPREVSVTFSANNAEPLFVKWAGGHIKDGKPENGTKHINVLTDEQKVAGAAVCVYDMGDNNDWQYGEYKIRVAFQTEYGIIHTPLAETITVN